MLSLPSTNLPRTTPSSRWPTRTLLNGFLLLCLLLCAACATEVPARTVTVYKAECPVDLSLLRQHPVVDSDETNGALLREADANKASLKQCNADKRSIQESIERLNGAAK